MVKKLKKMAEQQKAASGTGLLDSQLAQTVKDSAQQIWLAGLGAFSKAQGEGTKVFDTLMKEGLTLHRKTQSAAEERIGDVAGRMSQMAGQVGQQANASWDKLESIFEERTARALNRLGVPAAADMAEITERLAALEAAVAALGGATSGARSSASKAAPGQKTAARKATARKSASKTATKKATQTAARKAPAKKAAAKKASARKTSTRKTPARKQAD